MTRPIVSENFTVEDIHKIREYHYEMTKTMSKIDKIKEINDKAKAFEMEIKSKKVMAH